jgi:hypothetical protein
MHSSFVAELAARRHAIKHAWERKLRAEPITSPLANPDTLVLLMDRTLDDLQLSLGAAASGQTPSGGQARGARTGCLCGLNPLLAYFRVGASVIATTLSVGPQRPSEFDAVAYHSCIHEMLAEFQAIAHREIRTFCAMCQTELARGGRPHIGGASHSHVAVH